MTGDSCFYCNFKPPYYECIDTTDDDKICWKGHKVISNDMAETCDDYESDW
jgi:hypothetical protein